MLFRSVWATAPASARPSPTPPPVAAKPLTSSARTTPSAASNATTLAEALPDTRVNYAGDRTVANGWRMLDNYYAMRDMLGVGYMQ